MNALRTVIAAVLGLAVASGRAAPETAAVDAAQPAPETIIVVGRRERPLARVAARVTVFDVQALARTLSFDIRDAVRYEPGLSVPSDPLRFGLDTFRIRGIGGNRVAGEIDGIPVPDGFAVGSYSNSGRPFVPLDFVDQFEVLRGPASSLYGSDAIAGVVAFDTIDPADLAPVAERRIETRVSYRGQDESRSLVLLSAARDGPVELLGGLIRRAGGAMDVAGPVEPNPREQTSTSLLAKIVWADAASGAVEVSAMGDRADSRTDVRALLGLPGRFANTVAMQGRDEAEWLRLGVEQRLNDAPFAATGLWRAYFQSSASRQFTREARAAAPPRNPDPVTIERLFALDTANWGGEITFAADHSLHGWRHEFVYGAEFDATRLEEIRDGTAINQRTLVAANEVLGEVFPLRDFPRTDLREFGLFVQDDVRSPDDRWSLIPALRIDHYALEPDRDATYARTTAGRDAVAITTWSCSPKFGLIYRVDDGFSLFAQYARGFRAPPFADVNIGLEIPLFNVRAIPNPDLEPETSDGFELGVRAHGRGWQLEASAYYTDFDDFIESKVNLGPDPVTGVVLFQSRNVAQARIYGFEAELATSLARWAPGWSLRTSLAWSRGEEVPSGMPLLSIDPPRLVAAAAYASNSGRWGGELVVTAVDRKRGLDRRDADLHATDGYATVDLLGHFEWNATWSGDLALSNLTDERYEQWADVAGRDRTDPLLPYFGQPGRSISVSLTARF